MDEPHSKAPWLALIGVLSAICAALAAQVIPGIPDILPAMGGIFLAIFAFLGCVMSEQPRKITVLATASLAVGGAWATCAARTGISPLNITVLALAATAVLIIGMAEKRTAVAKAEAAAAMAAAEMAAAAEPSRDPREVAIECLLRRITKQAKLNVTKLSPWKDAENGMDISVDLPEGFTPKMLADYTDRIQASPTLHLPRGCVVSVVDGEYQCEAIVSIMQRDCLKDHLMLSESTEPASVNDKFKLMRAPQGHWFTVCLRIACMIVGGTTGSGKTTLLDRIIAHLARCTDALIWIVDFNGGGLGTLWTDLYENGKTDRPTIDWLADNEAEAALLLACAHGIATSRKTDREAVALRKAAGSKILPVSAEKPAIIVITDEGGEVRQAASVLGQVVCERISRLAQVGRAEGVRVIMSVLRGTSDLLDKALRAVCSIRICLRMDEEGEADHVLGRNPGRTHLLHTGSAWLYRTTEDYRPIIGRSVDVAPEFIERHSASTAHLRPSLDLAGQRICQGITLEEVFGGRPPENFPDLLNRPPLVDVTLGRAYTGRWERRKARLAAMAAGDDPNLAKETMVPSSTTTTDDNPTTALMSRVNKLMRSQPTVKPTTVVPSVDSEFKALTSAHHMLADGHEMCREEIPPQEQVPQSSSRTLREHLKIVLGGVSPNGLRAGQIEAALTKGGVSYSRKNMYEQLGKMVSPERGEAEKHGDQYFSPRL